MSIQSLIEADRKHLIHPVINYRAHEARGVTVLESASGAFLRDAEGNELLDAFSGLWCVNVGYGQQSIVKVAAEQMARLPYATSYFHFGNAPAIELAEKLVELSPASLQHVYFTLGGSDAVDSARALHHALLQRNRPAIEETHHRARTRLPRVIGGRRRTDRTAGVPSQLRLAAAEPASHPVAVRVSQQFRR